MQLVGAADNTTVVGADRKWADATEFIVEGSYLQMAGVFTDKIEVGSGVTIDFLEMSFRDGPMFKDSPDSEKILLVFTSAVVHVP